MNINDLATQLLYTTAPIWIEHTNGGTSSATSFIVNKQTASGIFPFLVTNKHVVQEAKRIIIRMAKMENNLPSKNANGINIELNTSDFSFHQTIDMAVMPFGHILNSLITNNTPVFYKGLAEDIFLDQTKANALSAIEDIIFIGYPSGLYDDKNLCPIIRRGITATPIWNNFLDEPKFLIDASVFPGSSGSPVFILNQGTYSTGNNIIVGSRLIFLGILSDTLKRNETDATKAYLNLGQVVKSEMLADFLNGIMIKIK